MPTRRVLVTGSRDWSEVAPIAALVDSLPLDAVVMHGNQRGADLIVDGLARARGLEVVPFDADWDRFGRSAGPRRNRRMVAEGKPTEAHAFPLLRSVGTWDCVAVCRRAGLRVWVVTPEWIARYIAMLTVARAN